MENKNKIIIAILIVIIIILSVLCFLFATDIISYNSNKITNNNNINNKTDNDDNNFQTNNITIENIKNKLEVNTEERTFKVNKVSYATDTVTINKIKMNVKDNTITLGDYTSTSNDVKNKQITGYYDQSSSTYKIYKLDEDSNGKTTIWEMEKNDTEPFNSVGWVNKLIDNATNIILIDCVETIEPMGQTPLRYQVYALVNNELVLIS